MNNSAHYIKWFYRLILSLSLMGALYVVTRPAYNFAHWVPHSFLRSIGFSHAQLLWAEQNADVALHFFGAGLLVWLIYKARISVFYTDSKRIFIFVVLLCFGIEITQYMIGRGLETSDLLLGILGSFMAYLGINKNKLSLT